MIFFVMSLGLSLGRPMYCLSCQIKEQTSPSDSYSLALPRTHAVLPSTGFPWLSVISTVPKPDWYGPVYLWEAGAALGQLAVKKGCICMQLTHSVASTYMLETSQPPFPNTSGFLSFSYHCYLHHNETGLHSAIEFMYFFASRSEVDDIYLKYWCCIASEYTIYYCSLSLQKLITTSCSKINNWVKTSCFVRFLFLKWMHSEGNRSCPLWAYRKEHG